ncbi:GntR family transcriptional regulator [Maribellus comscasis]|uniref:GntR family transcriptional regulator n=1 Tax=Maribellus comscasis TaxID=2681766 RepID=A0A6I6JVS3_9BACT|nr:S1-like domain-containing RNA-binding protein [Maribellus comscasis]QGY46681.1 GntR family transcriptional regulator [Maribellus comscasis]
MAEIGKINTLKVVRETDNGLYLDGENLGEILMPQKFATKEIRENNEAVVFVYSDSEDRLVATTENPLAKVGEFAYLKAVATSRFGAFLDWGLPKDLLVPFSEQKNKMEVGKYYLVYLFVDLLTNRIAASAKLNKFLDNTPPEYNQGEKVQLTIVEETDLGYKAIVNNEHWGILYKNQVFIPLSTGQRVTGYINKIREDDKIDLLLEKPGYEKIDSISQKILDVLNENRGFIALTDKSSPEMIQAMLGISKKNFKKALGNLYKKRMIEFKSDGIRLLD